MSSILSGKEGIIELKHIATIHRGGMDRIIKLLQDEGKLSNAKIYEKMENLSHVAWSNNGEYSYEITCTRRIGSLLPIKEYHTLDELSLACSKFTLLSGKTVNSDIIQICSPGISENNIKLILELYIENLYCKF